MGENRKPGKHGNPENTKCGGFAFIIARSHYRCRTSAKGLTRVHPHYRALQAEVSVPKAHQWVQRDKPEVMSVACHALRMRCLLAIARILALLNVFLFAHANH